LVGAPYSPALVVRVVAPNSSLDGAVAQARALLDRWRQGGLRDEDRSRAAAALARGALESSLDPRGRVIDLWRGQTTPPAPSLETLRAFASASLRDEAMVIIVARPARSDPPERPSLTKEPKSTSRDAGRE
jgi:hypothetical protein